MYVKVIEYIGTTFTNNHVTNEKYKRNRIFKIVQDQKSFQMILDLEKVAQI